MYTIESTETFLKTANKFFRKHPDLRGRFQQLVADLGDDPFQPKLRLHPLRGAFQGQYAVSFTYSYRITLTLLVSEKEITLLDIGDHDEVYR
jgi:mRNA-degrading endonuclease YafQ of YafQ-DinJ toxin-antitoxin module